MCGKTRPAASSRVMTASLTAIHSAKRRTSTIREKTDGRANGAARDAQRKIGLHLFQTSLVEEPLTHCPQVKHFILFKNSQAGDDHRGHNLHRVRASASASILNIKQSHNHRGHYGKRGGILKEKEGFLQYRYHRY